MATRHAGGPTDFADGLDRPRLLLHVCCGPCLTAVVERILPQFDVVGLWHNPNIDTEQEHELRLGNARIVAEHFGIELICADYDAADWLRAVAGLEQEPEGGRRCPVCFDYRLRRTVQYAAEHQIDHVATTLTVSPHKPLDVINRLGADLCDEMGIRFVGRNFRRGGGFQRSVELSRELGLYRQRYCGCAFARRDG